MRYDQCVSAALNAGAAGAVVIPGAQIALNGEFADLCRSNSCGNSGMCWMCPPDVGEVETLMARVRRFRRGMLYQTIGTLEDSFDIEGMQAAARTHAWTSQRIQEALRPLLEGEIFHLSCGGCNLCARCAKRDGAPCRMPERALTPMEAAGVDVYNTTKDTPLKYTNGQNTVTYFGLVLFDEVEHE